MTKRTLLILAGVLLVSSFCFSWAMVFRPFEKGPRYKGLPVSYWRKAVRDHYRQGKPLTLIGRIETFLGLRDQSGESAIFSGEPLTIPVLLHPQMHEDVHVSRAIFNEFCHTRLFSPPSPGSPEFVRAIVTQLQGHKIRSLAEKVLFFYSETATAELVAGLTSSLEIDDDQVRSMAAQILGKIGPEAAPAVPSLIKLLNDKAVAGEAAAALRQIDPGAARRAGVK